jgi:hypothetical protein
MAFDTLPSKEGSNVIHVSNGGRSFISWFWPLDASDEAADTGGNGDRHWFPQQQAADGVL